MSVKSVVGNLSRNVGDKISSYHSIGQSIIEKTLSHLGTRASNIWDGGFVGMSASGVEDLKKNMDKYCNDVQDIVKYFDANAVISEAIKGTEIEAAIHQYLNSIKELLMAYVGTMRQEIAEINEAYENFVVTTQGNISKDVEGVASDITSEAEKITGEAGNIKLD
jgi:hypothetical protein